MSRPTADIDACREAHTRLAAAIAGLTDDDVRAPSLLPDWSRGHLLTHIARNADSMVRRVEAAAAGGIADQYPGGVPTRAAEIEAGAGRSAAELLADVAASAARADDAFASCPDDAWDRMTRNVRGGDLPLSELPFHRWREAEAHLVDLGIGVGPDSFSDALVDRWLPSALAGAPGRTDPKALLAWLLRRGEAPGLRPF